MTDDISLLNGSTLGDLVEVRDRNGDPYCARTVTTIRDGVTTHTTIDARLLGMVSAPGVAGLFKNEALSG